MPITMYDIISRKRDGGALTEEQIAYWIDGVVGQTVPDYQTAALLMAICIRGMNDTETAILTRKMAESGDMVDLSALGDGTVDKHSTGGVGDKTTLLAAPLAAACGCVVAKMSGRGLGHTGGTVDKLESIPGFVTALETEKFLNTAAETGLVVAGQSGNLAPADKILYALRDVTATVGSIPLIASSIMSKKLAGGSRNIVLDVKVGNGAFMKSVSEAEELARAMMAIGRAAGRRVTAVLSRMDTPLGRMIGNSMEVSEAAALLKNPEPCDLLQISQILAAEMTALALQIPVEQAAVRVDGALHSGAGFDKLCEMVTAQGGDPEYLKDSSRFAPAGCQINVTAPESGYICRMDSEQIGLCAVQLGAGRRTKQSVIDPAAGICLHKKTGDRVRKGEPVATLYCADSTLAEQAVPLFSAALSYGEKPDAAPTVIKILRDL